MFQKEKQGPKATQNRILGLLSFLSLPCSLPFMASWGCCLEPETQGECVEGEGMAETPQWWRGQAQGAGALLLAYLRPGGARGMLGGVSTFSPSKEIPPRGGGGAQESSRCLSPSVCAGLTHSLCHSLWEGDKYLTTAPVFTPSTPQPLPSQDAFCLGV